MRALLAIALCACFSPAPQEGFACGPNGWCPDPLMCANDGTCRRTDRDGSVTDDSHSDGDSTVPNLAFVTDSPTTPAVVGGPAGGDALCTQLAHDAGHPGQFVAWISTTADPAFVRLRNARGWVRPDDKPFADTAVDLISGKIFYPLRRDQRNTDVGGALVMTATNPNGTATGDDCVMWTSTTTPIAIELGVADGTTGQWTVSTEGGCDQQYRMYCLQTDHDFLVAPTPASGPLAFVSVSMFSPAGGLVAADGLCQSDAAMAGKAGTFVAFLATRQASALSRVQPLPANPWVRVDGVPTTRDFATWEAPINVTARGDYVNDELFSGAATPSATAAADGSEDCNDWVAGANGGRVGEAARASIASFGGAGINSCSAHRILCLEH